jgi:hypothetical protein
MIKYNFICLLAILVSMQATLAAPMQNERFYSAYGGEGSNSMQYGGGGHLINYDGGHSMNYGGGHPMNYGGGHPMHGNGGYQMHSNGGYHMQGNGGYTMQQNSGYPMQGNGGHGMYGGGYHPHDQNNMQMVPYSGRRNAPIRSGE